MVAPPNGLMVPVIKDCDNKDIFQISQEIDGGYFTPIINAPEVAHGSCTDLPPVKK